MRSTPHPEYRARLWRLMCASAIIAAIFVSGICLGAGKSVPGSPPAPKGRWRKVVAWEGSFRATQRHRGVSDRGRAINTSLKTTSGHILLDTVKRTETLPEDKNAEGWVGSTIWTGKATGHVTIRLESSRSGPVSAYSLAEGSGETESHAELSVGVRENVYRGDVDALTIDVVGSAREWSWNYSRTTPINARDWIDIYSPVVGKLDEDESSWPGRKPTGESTDHSLEGPLPNAGLIIRGSYNAHGVRVDPNGDRKDDWRQVDWAYWPSDEVDLVVDIDGYDEWVPEGNVADWTQPGNHLTVKATLVTKDGKPSAKRKATKFIFQLVQVSQEPGICLNFPMYKVTPLAEADDLFFDPDRHPPKAAMFGSPRRVDLPGGNTAKAVLSSRDFGGYGILRVTALMEGGSSELPGHLRGDPARIDLMIPHSTDDSIIPLEWKQRKHVANLTDDRDNETVPGRDHPGDGLSLYEEYRGFVVRGKHMRTDPRCKTVFVHTKVPHADGGLRRLQAASGLQVLRINEDDYHGNKIRWVNFNNSGGANHTVDQHGLWIVSSKSVAHGGGQSVLGPPKYVDEVEMHYLNATWSRDFRDAVIAHELCHALAVKHHGDGNRYQLFTPGELPLYWGGGELYIAVQRGQNSGNDTCLIRYPAAHLIEKTPGDPRSLVYYGSYEPEGRTLCLTGGATGVNAPPLAKCGKAAEERGACMSQITVSDVYPWAQGDD